ncbi:MAG: beta-galactosidase [Polyangiaceae bacterium]
MYRAGWYFFAYVSSLALLIGCSGSGSTGLPTQNAGTGGTSTSTSRNPAGGSSVGGTNATGGLPSSGGHTDGGSSAASGGQTGGRAATGGATGGGATSGGSTAGGASGGSAVGGSTTGGHATGGSTAGGSSGSGGKVISYVDTSLNGSQKFMRVVDGKPYWGTEIQVRLDKLTYRRNWNATGRAAIMAQAASDGFNTVGIPVSWYEIEPTKDKFDWTILDEYLGLCKKNNLKMELLWFSMNSGSTVQWLGESYKPVHLRTPNYVLYSPSPGSNATTSEYKKTGAYTLDLKDTNLRTRETYVVTQLMAHIAAWDAANGSPHTVIGIQLGNEVYGPYAGDVQVAYYSAVAAAVKSSNYVIWTRMNNWTPHTKDQNQRQ